MSDRELDASLRDLPTPAAPPFGAELEAELAALAPVAVRDPKRQLITILAVAAVFGVIMVFVTGVRRDLGELPVPWLLAYLAAWVLGFTGLAALTVLPPRGAMMPRWRIAGLGGMLAAVGFVVAGLLMPRSGPSSVQLSLEELHRGHYCIEIGLVTALMPAVGCVVALRGVLPVGARWAAAGLGAAGGCFAGLVLHMHCPITDRWHLGFIHGGVVVLSAALSAAIAPRRMTP
ncbi:MAG: NrsF family protein [Deltaproteobacteria bacterium]|nr:NrsF family protein [Deltaproteobacteria bacterium]